MRKSPINKKTLELKLTGAIEGTLIDIGLAYPERYFGRGLRLFSEDLEVTRDEIAQNTAQDLLQRYNDVSTYNATLYRIGYSDDEEVGFVTLNVRDTAVVFTYEDNYKLDANICLSFAFDVKKMKPVYTIHAYGNHNFSDHRPDIIRDLKEALA
ncbi:hypothetical protein CMI42_01325 [Candidatus Pacearchaeota archaeon]|nr:hypothetical protein [Candidatus Pacearchaeota archaeon]